MSALLGKTVRDIITGFTGIADQYVEMLSGTKQYSIQPKGDGKELPTAYSFDMNHIELAEGPSVTATPAASNVVIRLGDEVENIITGEAGIATRRVHFINGCIYFGITPHDGGKEEGKDFFCNHLNLRIIEVQKFQRLKAEMDTENRRKTGLDLPAPAKPPGGPRTASFRV